MVLSVVEGGPAAKAGVMPGDILLSVDGAPPTGVRRVVPRLVRTASAGRLIFGCFGVARSSPYRRPLTHPAA